MKYIENNINYDKANDVLYYSCGDNSNSYGDEDPDNIVVMRDMNTDEVTGVTILDFLKMYKQNDNRLKDVPLVFDTNEIAESVMKRLF